MAQQNNITVHFKPSGDKAMQRAILGLAKAQAVLQGQTKKYTTSVKKLNVEQVKLNSQFGLQVKNQRLLGGSFATLRSKMLLASFAATILGATVFKLTQFFAEQEKAEKTLSTALGFTSQRLLDFAAAQQLVTTFGDEVTISAMAQAAAFTSNEQAIEQMTIAAQNLAAGRGMDLKTSMDLISKSVFSTTNALQRYGISIDQSLRGSDKFNAIMKAINQQFSGQATAQADTYAGSISQMKNAWGDLAETIGKDLADALTPIIKSFQNMAKWLGDKPVLAIIEALVVLKVTLMLTNAKLATMGTAALKATTGLFTLRGAVNAVKVSLQTLAKATVVMFALEAIVRLFSSFGEMKEETEEASVEIVELTGNMDDLADKMSKLRTISEFEKLFETLGTKEVMADIDKLNAKIDDFKATSLTKAFGEAIDDYNATMKEAMERMSNMWFMPEALEMKPISKQRVLKVLNAKGYEEAIKDIGKQSSEDLKGIESFMLDSQRSMANKGIRFLNMFYDEKDKLQLDGLEAEKIIRKALDGLAKKEESVFAKRIALHEELAKKQAVLAAVGLDEAKVLEKINQMKQQNLAWEASLLPLAERDLELTELKHQFQGAELEVQKLIHEGIMREQFLSQNMVDLLRIQLQQKEKLNNIMKTEAFLISNVNQALYQGISANGRFAESFGKMVKQMAAQLTAHMATFLLFRALFPKSALAGQAGGFMGALKYALGKMTGATFSTAGTGGGIETPWAGVPFTYHNGGAVGGSGNVPAVLQSGEYVMSRDAVESIGIENLNRMNQSGSGSVVVNFSGNVMSQDFIENDAIPRIKEAIRRCADIGVS